MLLIVKSEVSCPLDLKKEVMKTKLKKHLMRMSESSRQKAVIIESQKKL
jgi:hypothetical protein